MGKARFIEPGDDGCGGFFRAVNCRNELEMLSDVIDELRPKIARAGENHTLQADAASTLAVFALSEARASDDLTLIHKADQWDAAAEQLRDNTPRECRVRCPGKKPFSSLCQAKLILVRQNGETEEY